VPQRSAAEYRLIFEDLLGIPFSAGNRIDVLRNGCQIFPAMLQAISGAERTIEFLTFIYWQGDIAEKFADALAERAAAGIKVKVLLDAFGAASMSEHLIDRMSEAGAEIRWFRPLVQWKLWKNDNRTHRKVLIVDGEVGFTGGVGIAEEWEGDARDESEWRDTHFRIIGPAVHGLNGAFYGNWVEAGGTMEDALDFILPAKATGSAYIQVIRSSAAVGWSDIAFLLQTLLVAAQRRLRIVTPYLAPDQVSTELLIDARHRGVNIDIMIPGPHTDKRISELSAAPEIESWLMADVAIWQYQPSMIHAKVILVDDTLACVGSANFNHRSVLKDDEVALITDCPATVATLNQHFDEDLARCKPIDPRAWKKRGIARTIKEFASRPFQSQA
jgi:cardiolipin synthase